MHTIRIQLAYNCLNRLINFNSYLIIEKFNHLKIPRIDLPPIEPIGTMLSE